MATVFGALKTPGSHTREFHGDANYTIGSVSLYFAMPKKQAKQAVKKWKKKLADLGNIAEGTGIN